MRNAGVIISDFFDKYCQCHRVKSDILTSVAKDNPGIGTVEKRQDRKERLTSEAVKSLARQLWHERGSPQGGPTQFENEARDQLKNAMKQRGDGQQDSETPIA